MTEKRYQALPGGNAGDESELASEENLSKEELGQIGQTGSITSAKGKHVFHCLSIIGQI